MGVVKNVVKDVVEVRQLRGCKRCRFHVPSFFLLLPVTGRRNARLVESADLAFTELSLPVMHYVYPRSALSLSLRSYGSYGASSRPVKEVFTAS